MLSSDMSLWLSQEAVTFVFVEVDGIGVLEVMGQLFFFLKGLEEERIDTYTDRQTDTCTHARMHACTHTHTRTHD